MVAHVFETDAKIVSLVHCMKDTFTFVGDLKTLSEKVRTLQEPIVGLLKQTIECCAFIEQYAKDGFGSESVCPCVFTRELMPLQNECLM